MPGQVVIIGNGIAGITAARHIRRISDKKIKVISAESDYFFSRTALMYVYMGHMSWENIKPYADWFWAENRIDLIRDYVEKIEPSSKRLRLRSGDLLEYDQLILATGSSSNKFGWPGENLPGVQGLVSKQDLELLEKNTRTCKHAVIVGGGLIGVELAEMLHSREIPVTMLIREAAFWRNAMPEQDAGFISRHVASHGIRLRHEEQLVEIRKNTDGRVQSVKTDKDDEIACDFVGLAAGVHPNISFLSDSQIETDKGILVNEYLETSQPDIYAIGDCAQHRTPPNGRAQVEAVWYTSRMMGETVAQNICGNRFRYRPGPWFNSAKFFDIEFQTYGNVAADPAAEEQHFHWEHRDGTKAITMAFRKTDFQFLGINSFGIRMKHEVLAHWLSEGKSIDFVLKNLEQANFNPEFYQRHQPEIFSTFKQNLMPAGHV